MSDILIVGASRGLGASLAKQYASKGDHVYASSRSNAPADTENITYISGIDVAKEEAGSTLVSRMGPEKKLKTVIITAGYFGTEVRKSQVMSSLFTPVHEW